MSDSELERVRQLLSKAQTYLKARQFETVLQLAEQAVARIEKAMGLGADGSGAPPAEIDMALAEEHVAALELRGMAKRHLGQLPASVEDLMLAVGLRRTLTADDELPSNDLAVALHNLGNALLMIATAQSLSAALDAYAEAIAIREKLMKTPGHGHVASDLAGTYKARANVEGLRARKGMHAELGKGRADLERALEIRKKLVEIDGRKEFAGALAMTKYSLGDLLGMQFKFGDAIALLSEAVTTMRSLVAAGQRHLRDDLALCLSARVLYGIGAAETIRGQTWPIEAALECAALYGELIAEGRTDQLAAFGEFVSQRAMPCLFKAGKKDLAAQCLAQALKTVLDQAEATGLDAFAQTGALMLALPAPVKAELRRASPGLDAQVARLERLL